MVHADNITEIKECEFSVKSIVATCSYPFQDAYEYEIQLDGEKIYSVRNDNQQSFENVKVWTNDHHGAEPAGGVRIRNLYIESGSFSYPPGKLSIKNFHEVFNKQNVYQGHKLHGRQQSLIPQMGAGNMKRNISSIQQRDVSCPGHQRVYIYRGGILMVTPRSIGFWIIMVLETVIVETN